MWKPKFKYQHFQCNFNHAGIDKHTTVVSCHFNATWLNICLVVHRKNMELFANGWSGWMFCCET